MLSIIYTYRNREITRITKSLDSLEKQTNKNFEVFFINYGSSEIYSSDVEQLMKQYPFVHYQVYPVKDQPWNKSRAINTVVKNLKTEFCFIADIDIIFHPNFIAEALKLQKSDQTIYFQVGFLNKTDTENLRVFADDINHRKSTPEATGLSMFPVSNLKELRGFDEFYHFWGSEDTDIHVRLKNAGYEVQFYDKEVLLLHQWHQSYRSRELSILTKELRLSGIVQINGQHLKQAIERRYTKVNHTSWGRCMSIEECLELENYPVDYIIHNQRQKVDEFLFGQLPQLREGCLKIIICKDPLERTLKQRVKKVLGKKVPQYYNLKEINDKLILHLISYYRDNPYLIKINEKVDEIELAIKIRVFN